MYYPCSDCSRHLRERDRVCPFCGAVQHMADSPGLRGVGAFALVAVTMLGTSACAKHPVDPGDLGGDSESSSTTTANESGESDGTDSTETDSGDLTTNTTGQSLSFYAGPDEDVPDPEQCDPWLQDCPEGDKCVAYGSTGGAWDANKCVPILGDQKPGEPCNYAGTLEATDDCDASSYCWNVMDVDGQPIGTCTAFCQGSPNEPACGEGTTCLIAGQGSINLCVQACDPLAQDCPAGLGCFWDGLGFSCLSTTQDLPEGEACGYLNDCAPGLVCMPQELFPACAGMKCCTAYCDTEDPDACPDPELECVAFFDNGLAPMGLETLGVCVLPSP